MKSETYGFHSYDFERASEQLQLDRDHFLTVLQYVIMTKDINEEKLEEIIKEAGGDIIPSLAQRWIDQGKEQGLQQGYA